MRSWKTTYKRGRTRWENIKLHSSSTSHTCLQRHQFNNYLLEQSTTDEHSQYLLLTLYCYMMHWGGKKSLELLMPPLPHPLAAAWCREHFCVLGEWRTQQTVRHWTQCCPIRAERKTRPNSADSHPWCQHISQWWEQKGKLSQIQLTLTHGVSI